MKILLNGKEEILNNATTTISTLLQKKEIKKEIVTIELNGNIIDKKDYDSITLKEKDVLELVYFMGGGFKK